MQVICPYCNKNAKIVSGKVIYPHRPDLRELRFWYCADCKAWVGCHKLTDRPLGRLANKELRLWKMKAHELFDPKWRRDGMKRIEAYQWLAIRLGIPYKDCHIGMFDVEMCKKTVEVCKEGDPQ